MDFDDLSSFPLQKRWRQQTSPMPVVVSIIWRDIPNSDSDKSERCYLLIRRKNAPYRDRWALVGGGWDFGETLVSAALREVKEETGLDAEFMTIKGVVSERLVPALNDDGEAAHFLIFVCQLAAPNGVAREQDEGAVTWFNFEEIEELHHAKAIIPSDFIMLRRFIGPDPLAHHEAEMVTGPSGEKSGRSMELVGFEKIS